MLISGSGAILCYFLAPEPFILSVFSGVFTDLGFSAFLGPPSDKRGEEEEQ